MAVLHFSLERAIQSDRIALLACTTGSVLIPSIPGHPVRQDIAQGADRCGVLIPSIPGHPVRHPWAVQGWPRGGLNPFNTRASSQTYKKTAAKFAKLGLNPFNTRASSQTAGFWKAGNDRWS